MPTHAAPSLPALRHRKHAWPAALSRWCTFVGLALIVACWGPSAAALADALELGEPAPPIELVTLDGTHIATSALRGQVVIVTFWATWCVPCKKELPVLSNYFAQHADSGLQILGFSLDEPSALPAVREAAIHLRFPVGLLGSPWAKGYGRIWRIPVSFVIDRSGRLVDNGWDDFDPVWTAARLQRIVTPLLAPAAAPGRVLQIRSPAATTTRR